MCTSKIPTGILDLPVELIHDIYNKLDIRDVLSLRDSCEILASRINSESFWQNRLLHKIPAKYPCFPGKRVNWAKACMAREEIMGWLAENSQTCPPRVSIQPLANCIDAVHIFDSECNNLFACGDRAGELSVISFSDALNSEEPTPIFKDTHKHKGWIWSISSRRRVFATTCWDSKMRLWSLDKNEITALQEFKMNGPVLCSAFVDENLIAAGTSRKALAVYDLRAPPEYTALSASFHQGAVLCVKSPLGLPEREENVDKAEDLFASSSNSYLRFSDNDDDGDDKGATEAEKADASCSGDNPHLLPIKTPISETQAEPTSTNPNSSSLSADTVPPSADVNPNGDTLVSPTVSFYSGSEDQFLAAWDLRNLSKPVSKKKFSTYPRAISLLDRDEMWVAVVPQNLYVFRTSSLDTYKHTRSQSCTINVDVGVCVALQVTPGAIFITGTPPCFYVLHPTMPPLSMTAKPVLNNYNAPPVSLCYANETLLVGMGNGMVQIWTSKQQLDAYRI